MYHRAFGIAIVFGLLSGSVATAQDAQQKTFRIASGFQKDSPVGSTVENFANILREQLSGQLTVEVVPPDGPLLMMLSSGRADLAVVATTELNEVSKSAFAVYDLPFLFASAREVAAVQQSAAGVSAMASLQPAGYVGLGYWNNGINSLLTREAVNEGNDLKGRKIRVTSQNSGSKALTQFGATPVTLPLGDLSSAVTTGAVDGFETSPRIAAQVFPTGVSQGDFSVTQLRPVVGAVIMSDAGWKKLSFKAQSVIADQVSKAAAVVTETALAQDNEALKLLAERGGTRNVSSVVFNQSAQPVWSKTQGIEGTNVLGTVLPVIDNIRNDRPANNPQRRGSVDEIPIRVASASSPAFLLPGEVLFATDRAWENEPEARYKIGANRGALGFGLAKFDIHPNRRMGNIDESLSPMSALSSLTDAQFAAKVSTALANRTKKEILVFVHGFNNTFEGAARALALMTADINFGGVSILYSWPSDGAALRYASDEEEVRVSRGNFLAFVQRLARMPGVAKIHVAAHSMGNRLVTEAIDRFDAGASNGAPRLFHHVVMAAPDVYVQLFQQTADAFRRQSERITLYASEKDAALNCSRHLHNNRRLGEAGAGIYIAQGVDTVDASATEPAPPLLSRPCSKGHAYMMRSLRIQSDLQSLVLSDLPPAARHGLAAKQKAGMDYWAFREAD